MSSDLGSQVNDIELRKSIDLMDKVTSLIAALECDLDACDFKWTLFVAAANNYKFDSLLKPFPSAYLINRTLNIGRLREVITSIPPFSHLLQTLRNHPNALGNPVNDEAIDLLYWCLISVKEPVLKSIGRSNVSIAGKQCIKLLHFDVFNQSYLAFVGGHNCGIVFFHVNRCIVLNSLANVFFFFGLFAF